MNHHHSQPSAVSVVYLCALWQDLQVVCDEDACLVLEHLRNRFVEQSLADMGVDGGERIVEKVDVGLG